MEMKFERYYKTESIFQLQKINILKNFDISSLSTLNQQAKESAIIPLIQATLDNKKLIIL